MPESATAREKVLTERNGSAASELTPAANNVVIPGTPAPVRSITGETVSITNKGNPMDWDDEDDGAKTAIARPGELPGLLALRAARKQPTPPPAFSAESQVDLPQQSAPSLQPLQDSYGDFDAVRPRRTGLILALLVLAALAVFGLLVLLDVVPLPKVPGSGRKVGQVIQVQASRAAT